MIFPARAIGWPCHENLPDTFLTPLFNPTFLTTLSILVFGLLTSAGAADNAEHLPAADEPAAVANSFWHETLAQDSAFQGPFSARFEIDVRRNLLGPDRGRHTKVCEYVAANGAVGLCVETRYEADPPYRAVDTPGYKQRDFDLEGNLIVWRALTKVSLSTPAFNRTYDDQERLLVGPSGKVLERGRHVIIYEYPLGSRDNFYEFDQFRMAAGRGFSDGIGHLKSERKLKSDVRELVFDGQFGPRLRGEWYLYVDTGAGYLVRQADLFIPTRQYPIVHVENIGIIQRDGLTLALHGSLTHAVSEEQNYVLDVTVLDFSLQPDGKHLERMRALVTRPFPPGAEIVDYRHSPARRYPANQHRDK